MSKVSAVEKGRINKEKYAAYVAELEATGEKFPTNSEGNLNLSLIARKCGFGRDVFYKNQTLNCLLNDDAQRIGTTLKPGVSNESRLAKRVAEKSNVASKLTKELDARIQEIEILKKTIDELQSKIIDLESRDNEVEMAMDELLSNGRRFIL